MQPRTVEMELFFRSVHNIESALRQRTLDVRNIIVFGDPLNQIHNPLAIPISLDLLPDMIDEFFSLYSTDPHSHTMFLRVSVFIPHDYYHQWVPHEWHTFCWSDEAPLEEQGKADTSVTKSENQKEEVTSDQSDIVCKSDVCTAGNQMK